MGRTDPNVTVKLSSPSVYAEIEGVPYTVSFSEDGIFIGSNEGLPLEVKTDSKTKSWLFVKAVLPANKGGERKMNLVYGISRWTNPSRASARHIDDSFGKPLCGDKRQCTWETEQGEPTCQKCISKYKCCLRKTTK